MAVSFRAVGTWAELTADGPVVIPATPQAGDRMYLFARWKDFSVTAQVTSPVAWTEVAEFADGSTSAGNGTGSVKVACWYRDWQSGDTDPTIDFSASPDNASAVIMIMAKDAADSWLTPVAVTAAMTNWTTTSQIVAASSTANVLGGGVVMGLIGLRDDSATMTRPTSGIDDSAAAITWNGNYVESPATHHSTTTGFDGAADLGYRLVTAGATATLRMTGTISAAETGAALWVVQGVQANLGIDDSGHLQSVANLALTQDHALAVANNDHGHAAESLALTQVHVAAIQGAEHDHAAASLTLTQVHSLVAQDASHDHAADSLTIEVTHHLVIQDAAHDHLSDSLTLELVHHLITDDSDHGHTAEDLILGQVHELVIADSSHEHTVQGPNVRTFQIIFLDPGGDAVHAPDYFHKHVGGSGGDITYDPTVQVAGVGSYRFDSNTNEDPTVELKGVLIPTDAPGLGRRVSFYWRYDSVPDKIEMVSGFALGGSIYSGGGFIDSIGAGISNELSADDASLAFATPAKNSGQGHFFDALNLDVVIPIGAVIDSVKIIYERKYDTVGSIGISRVKYRIDAVEGPDHDNTDMPLTDTVVEVDVTGDRAWGWEDFLLSTFEVIAEARRGDTDTEHTQSWDYVKVEVEYHLATAIMALPKVGGGFGFQIAITPKGAHSVVRFVDGAGVGYDGITRLLTNTQNRISFSYVVHDTDDLAIKVYVNGIQELSIEQASTGGVTLSSDLHYGWPITPGIDHRAWFSHLAIDEGDDLTDIGNVLSTAKRSAAVNEDNWNTVGGTGAVNERPLSETNYVEELEGIARLRQSYTLEEIDEGDVDLTGESLIGKMFWAWARVSGTGEPVDLIANNVLVDRTAAITGTSPLLLTAAVTDSSYPSHAAGIGMRNAPELLNTFMYEGGVVVAYEGPPDVPLFPMQILMQDSVTPVTDDLRADLPETYELLLEVSESNAQVSCEVYAITSEGQEPQLRQTLHSGGGSTREPIINPGIEISLIIRVAGANAYVRLRRRLNIPN